MAAASTPSWLNSPAPTESAPAPAAPATTAAAPSAPAPTNFGDALGAPPVETKPPAEVQPAGGEKQKAEEPKADGAKPEAGAYEAFNLPEGYVIAEQDLAVFTQLGQEFRLPQEGAQKLVDLAVGVVENTRQQIAAESAAESEQIRAEWKQALLADPELGGAKFQATQANFTAFGQSKFADPELLGFLQESGLMTHPSVARLLSRIGASLRETPVGFGSDQPKQQRSPAHEIFSKSGHV